MSKDQFTIDAEPDFFIPDAVCPYCKKSSLGLLAISDNPLSPRYTFACMNTACVTNGWAPLPMELADRVKQALGQ